MPPYVFWFDHCSAVQPCLPAGATWADPAGALAHELQLTTPRSNQGPEVWRPSWEHCCAAAQATGSPVCHLVPCAQLAKLSIHLANLCTIAPVVAFSLAASTP
eukprot:3318065-Amphidinium_carterae.1